MMPAPRGHVLVSALPMREDAEGPEEREVPDVAAEAEPEPREEPEAAVVTIHRKLRPRATRTGT